MFTKIIPQVRDHIECFTPTRCKTTQDGSKEKSTILVQNYKHDDSDRHAQFLREIYIHMHTGGLFFAHVFGKCICVLAFVVYMQVFELTAN